MPRVSKGHSNRRTNLLQEHSSLLARNQAASCPAEIRVGLAPGARFGLFATKDIKAGARYEYLGERLSKAAMNKRYAHEPDHQGPYCVALTNPDDTPSGYYIDGSHGNFTRYLNDYRGQAATFNAVLFANTQRVHVELVADVVAGAQLLLDYGLTSARDFKPLAKE